MTEKFSDFDRVLRHRRMAQEADMGLWRLLEQQKTRVRADDELDRMLDHQRKAMVVTGDLRRSTELAEEALESVGGIDQLLAQQKAVMEANGQLGWLLQQYQIALEAAGGWGYILEQHRLVLEVAREFSDAITIETGKRSGQPCIRGIRMTVYDVLEYLAGGMSETEILHDFPDLTLDDLDVCRAFAAALDLRLKSLPGQ